MTIIIVFDGGSYSKFKKWLDDGELPFIKSITKSFNILESSIPVGTCPAAITLFTGLNASQLNIKSIVKEDGKIVNRNDIPHEFLWEYLSNFNYKSCVLFPPMTYPPKKFNGILITDYGAPSNKVEMTYPKEIKDELNVPDFNKIIRDWKELTKDQLLEKIKNITKQKIEIFKKAIAKDKFDLTILYMNETDSIQHYLYDDDEILLTYYKYVDKELEIIKNRYKNIMIISDHGFKNVQKNNFYINSFLKSLNLIEVNGNQKITKISNSILEKINKSKIMLFLTGNFPLFRKMFLKITKSKIKNMLSVDIDKKRSKAYAIDDIGIYVKDKEIKKIIEDNLKKYGHAIKNWYDNEKYYNVKNDNFPDIILEFDDDYDGKIEMNEEIIKKAEKREIAGMPYRGTHHKNGIIITNMNITKEKPTIHDVTPSILNLFNIPKPKKLLGNSLFNTNKAVMEKTNEELENINNILKNIKI